MKRESYPSDLTDEQWAVVEPLIPVYPGGRPRKTDLREVLNAIFYLLKTGCPWRFLPKHFPPKSTVWGYFDEWRHNGTLEQIQRVLRERARCKAGRKRTPKTGYIDSQSVPTSEGGEQTGYDGGKKVDGRKRHLVVDSLGLLLAVLVTAANIDDGAAASQVLEPLTEEDFSRLRVIWGDNKYHNHQLADWIEQHSQFRVIVVRKPEGQKGFELLPKRWVVERSFAWLKKYRRLSVDREKSIRSCEAMIQLAMIHRTLNYLYPKEVDPPFRYRKAG